jgi:Domain of unknown function (DUF4383)
MTTQSFARLFGWLYVAVGILGFIPGIVQPTPVGAPVLAADTGYGYLMGLFPINMLHNLVHIGLGAWGIAAAGSWLSARMYAKSLAVFYGVLAVMGLIPLLNTTFGLIPIFGHDVWLHALTAAVAAYFGYGAGAMVASDAQQWRKAS